MCCRRNLVVEGERRSYAVACAVRDWTTSCRLERGETRREERGEASPSSPSPGFACEKGPAGLDFNSPPRASNELQHK